MIEDILYKTLFILMLVAFPLFYLVTSIVNVIRYFRFRKKTESLSGIYRLTNIVNISLIIWSLLCIIIYATIAFITNGKLYYDIEVESWFYIPLLITILLLLFPTIRKSVFSWLFFTGCIVTGWIFYITFLQLSIS